MKADLSYLLSLSKNKKHVLPTLDHVINKIKSPNIDLSTIELAEVTKKAKKHFSKGDSLVLYETCNAFDLLRNEALQKSRLQMEQCNKKIFQERERSREKIKQKNLNLSTEQHQ